MVSVSDTVAVACPTVRAVLQRIAVAPGSRIVFASPEHVRKEFRKALKRDTAAWKHKRILCDQQEREGVEPKWRPVYANAADFIHAFETNVPDVVCPGCD